MIKADQIKEILSLYKKHGWNLRRVLLCDELRKSLSGDEIEYLFGDARIIESEINAAWFSRDSKHGNIAWEIRHLSETPYAILELIESTDDENKKTEKLKITETRMAEYASNKTDGKGA